VLHSLVVQRRPPAGYSSISPWWIPQ